MRITTTLDHATVSRLLGELTPLTLRFQEAADGNWARIDRPREVEFIEGTGLRVVADVTVHGMMGGFPVEGTAERVTLALSPRLEGQGRAGRLVFKPRIEELALPGLPGFVDDLVCTFVNSMLVARAEVLAWKYGETLSHSFSMPAAVAPLRSFDLDAGDAAVIVYRDRLVLSLTLEMRFRADPPGGG